LPRDRWDSLEGLTKDKLNVLLCYSEVCHLAATAAVQFATAGFPIMELDGGMRAWREYKMPIQA
jgi:rhodanese-related sulfurtransferase